MIPVPFRLKVPGQDHSSGGTVAWTTFQVHGLASLDGQSVRLEWSGSGTLDRVRGMDVQSEVISLPIESLLLPLPDLRSIQLIGGWLRPRIEITANELAVLGPIPGAHDGRIHLWLARGDRRLASTLIQAVHEAVRQLRLSPGSAAMPGPPTPTP